MSDIKEATIRTATPLLIATIIGVAVGAAFTLIPADFILLAGMIGVLVYLTINLFQMNLDIVRAERKSKHTMK